MDMWENVEPFYTYQQVSLRRMPQQFNEISESL